MANSRRDFIRTAGIGTLGISLLPSIGAVSNVLTSNYLADFPRTSPESQGVSSKIIRQFIAAANASGIGWHSFMLLRHGNVIAEGWWKPFEPAFKHTLYSLSKSFTSTAIGLLVKDGKLNIEDKLISFFPTEVPAAPDANLQQMKVKHLLTMNTGHAEDTMPKLRASADAWTKTFLAQPVKFEPGSHFLYNTGATYMLGAIVYKITGQTLYDFLTPRLFQPLDIKGYDWETSPQGLNTAGYGLRVKTADIAKLGQLYLQKGKWKGKEILTESWVNDATSFQTKSQEGNGDWSQGYGYQFWRCKPGFYRGDGAYGQFCIVMPQHDAVIAVTSESWDMQKSMTTIWENLLPGFQAAALPEDKTESAALKKDLGDLLLPVPKGKVFSDFSSASTATYKMDKNDFGILKTSFSYSKNTCRWSITTEKETIDLLFGWENWLVSKDSISYPFPVPGRLHMPSKIAGTATWILPQSGYTTLQLNARFVEAIHGDTITCSFTDKLTISFLNSVAENSKTDIEKRVNLTGTIS